MSRMRRERGETSVWCVVLWVVFFGVLVWAFLSIQAVLDGAYQELGTQVSGADGGVRAPTSATDYVELKLRVSEQRELMLVRVVSVIIALGCALTGLLLLLLSARASASVRRSEKTTTVEESGAGGLKTTEETETTRPAMGPVPVGLFLVGVGVLVILFAPRGSAVEPEGTHDAGTPGTQATVSDAGPPCDGGSPCDGGVPGDAGAP